MTTARDTKQSPSRLYASKKDPAMNELIKVVEHTFGNHKLPTINARELHAFLGVRTASASLRGSGNVSSITDSLRIRTL